MTILRRRFVGAVADRASSQHREPSRTGRFAPDALSERAYKRTRSASASTMRRSTRRGFTTGHGGAQAARHEVDRGNRDQNQQNQEGYLAPFEHADLFGEMQPDAARA